MQYAMDRSMIKAALAVISVATAVLVQGTPSSDVEDYVTVPLPTSYDVHTSSHNTPWPTATTHVQGGTGTGAAVSTTTPTSQVQDQCEDITRCLADANCSQCLAEVGRAVAAVLDNASCEDCRLKVAQVGPLVAGAFTRVLVSTEACAAAPPDTLAAALNMAWTSPCNHTAGFLLNAPANLGTCVTQSVFQCYLEGHNCTSCVLARVDIDVNTTKGASLRLPECSHPSTALVNVVENCSLGACTAMKAWCMSSQKCAGCLATLNSGKPATAARLCPFRGSDEEPQMADLVST